MKRKPPVLGVAIILSAIVWGVVALLVWGR
jgi:hypothetical protein